MKDDYWNSFTMTGRISDYLAYKEEQHKDKVIGKLIGDLEDGRQVNSNRDDIVSNSHW